MNGFTSKALPQHDISPRSNSSLSSVSLTEFQRSPNRSVSEIDRQNTSSKFVGWEGNESTKSPTRDVFSRGASDDVMASNVSLKDRRRTPSPFSQSTKDVRSTKPTSAKSLQNGAIVDNFESEITEMPDVYSPHLVTGRDFIPTGTPPSPATYHVATKSVPTRPNSASRPQTSLSVPKRKEKMNLVVQSIPNLRRPSSPLSLMWDDNRVDPFVPSKSSSSSGSRPSTGKSSAVSRIASSLLSKLPTTPKLLRAWDDDPNRSTSATPSRSSSSPRPGTSASKKSSRSSDAGSAVFFSDQESLKDGENCDMQWRTKLRLNCFLPPLSDK